MRKPFAKTAGIIFGTVLLAAGSWYSLRPVSESRRLPGGSGVSVEWVAYGRTNVFVDGNLLERTFGSLLQKFKGLGLAFLKAPTRKVFSDPEGKLMFRLRFENVDRQSSPFFLQPHKRPRIIVSDASTAHRYLGHIWDAEKSRNGRDWHAYVSMTAFPRAQKYLKVDIEDEQGELLARLSVKNPGYVRRAPITPAASPTQISVGDMDVTFGSVEFPEKAPLGFGGMPPAVLNLKISRGGLTVTNWRLADATFRDPYENHQFTGTSKTLTNDWQRYRLYGFLDPANAWKAQFGITKDADFSPDELCTFDVKYPLVGQTIEVCHGRRLQVAFVNTDMLSVDLLDTNANVRLTFIGAADEQGKLESGTGSWSQHRFWRALDQRKIGDTIYVGSPKPGTVFRVTVAIHTNYPVEHIFVPGKAAQKSR